MKRALLPIVLGAAMFSSTANAAVAITSVAATPVYSGPAATYNFDGATPAITGGAFASTDVTSQHITPLGSTGRYYAVGPADGSPAILTLAGGLVDSISLLWGSVDDYNTLQLLDSSNAVLATITGSQVIGNGTFGTSTRLVTLALTDATQNVAKLRFSSTSNAFEFDNVTINAAVPEPTTWMMLILGMIGVGFAMRRRNETDVRVRYV